VGWVLGFNGNVSIWHGEQRAFKKKKGKKKGEI
jgi:hypothetical protein